MTSLPAQGATPGVQARVRARGAHRKPADRRVPRTEHAASTERTHQTRRLRVLLLRLAACAASLSLSALVLRESVPLRIFEAWLSGHAIPLLTAIRAGAIPHTPIVWFSPGPHRYFGLFVTPECTVATLTIPFMLSTAWAIWHQARLMRPLFALAVAVGLLIAMNQIRLLVIILLILRLGYGSGFYWGHTLAGSLITVFGVVLVFLVHVLVVVRRKGSRQNHGAQANTPATQPAG